MVVNAVDAIAHGGTRIYQEKAKTRDQEVRSNQNGCERSFGMGARISDDADSGQVHTVRGT